MDSDEQFSANEVFQMAEQIEKNVAKFYRQAADAAPTPQQKQVFMLLSVMEDDHEQIFSVMRTNFAHTGWTQARLDSMDEVARYWRIVVDPTVLGVVDDMATRFSPRDTPEQTLRKGIQFERDSIVFYLRMKETIAEPEGRMRIDGIIKEEVGHIIELSSALANLNKQVH